jgi:plasmid stabilization system protein ParE
MKVEYSNRAVADLHNIAADSLRFGNAVAAALEARIRVVIGNIAEHPAAAQRVADRPVIHVVPLIRYHRRSFTECWMIA